jgi:hypothetical protein
LQIEITLVYNKFDVLDHRHIFYFPVPAISPDRIGTVALVSIRELVEPTHSVRVGFLLE